MVKLAGMRMKKNINIGISMAVWIAAVLVLIRAATAVGGEAEPVLPSPKDKCPVCGMFVAKYPDFLAKIIFKDNSVVFFDGPKDMFKYYFNLQEYERLKRRSDIDTIYVTDYYHLTQIDGQKARYVMGSDIYGPMGRELIPFEKPEDAGEFLKDHNGRVILEFGQVSYDIVQTLD